MKRRLPVRALAGLCLLFVPSLALCQSQSAVVGAPASLSDYKRKADTANPADDPNLPDDLRDVIRACELRYAEGSSLIKSGESVRSRAAFDSAIDLLLKPEWDIAATPTLNRYFQDLIQRIQRDESRYLRTDDGTEDSTEEAVFDELEKVDLIPIQVDPSLKDAVEADILNSSYDIPVVVNESVYKSMNYWLSRGRKYFVDGLSRSGRYQEMIERVFHEESIPPDLMYLAQVESLFKPNALSRALAKGIWQFARGTAVRYGLRVDRYIDERSDPEKSTRAAARYLKDLYDMFNDWNLVLAAYNWGEGKVQRLVERSGVADFWQLAELKRKMPAETKNHVPMIMASIILAHNPDRYGLLVEPEVPLACDHVPVTKRLNLAVAAKALDIPVDQLKKLNPALRTSYTPPNYPGFELNVPLGMGVDFEEKLASLPAADLRMAPDFNGRHKVEPGETLGELALLYHVSVEDLMAANDITSPRSMRAGSLIYVPGARATGSSASIPADFDGGHLVRNGDTLGSIARRYGVSVEAIQAENGIGRPESLRAGTVLTIPGQGGSTSASAGGKDAGQRHQVRRGETLSSIAARYGVSVSLLQKINGISSPKSLQIGMWLEIPKG